MKIGIIFSGYSSQFIGMGKDLYDDYRIVQEFFEEAYNCSNINFVKLCFADSEEELAKIDNAYLSIFLINAAMWQFFKEKNLKPDLITGHGIGFYSAVFASQGFTFPDGLYLLKKLSSFIQETTQNSSLAALKVEGIASGKLKKIMGAISDDLIISVYNGSNEFIVSGQKSSIIELKNNFKEMGFKIQDVSFILGLYPELMKSVVEQFKAYLEKVDFKDLQTPVINFVDGKELISGKQIKKNIIQQIDLPIKWDKVLDKFESMDIIIEVGARENLLGLIKQRYPSKSVLSFSKKADLEKINEILLNIDKEQNGIESRDSIQNSQDCGGTTQP